MQHVLCVLANVASHSLLVPVAAHPYWVLPAAKVSTRRPVAVSCVLACVFLIFFQDKANYKHYSVSKA